MVKVSYILYELLKILLVSNFSVSVAKKSRQVKKIRIVNRKSRQSWEGIYRIGDVELKLRGVISRCIEMLCIPKFRFLWSTARTLVDVLELYNF